jgi:hypothetical protein
VSDAPVTIALQLKVVFLKHCDPNSADKSMDAHELVRAAVGFFSIRLCSHHVAATTVVTLLA